MIIKTKEISKPIQQSFFIFFN